jgi:glycosyltransferase
VKVSIITAVLNNRDSIEDCIKSVSSQSFKNIEHIVIDGGSSDGTLELLREHQDSIFKIVSEPDDGIYHALNKGIRMATGGVIGFLHADDVYANHDVIETVSNQMESHGVDSCYGDLVYVSKRNTDRTVRYWKSGSYKEELFRRGWMPPHPTFFVKKEVYDKYGCFNTDFRIAADYELMLRLLKKNKVSTHYIPGVMIKMRVGGSSNRSLNNILIKSSEDYRAWKINNLNGGLSTIVLKNLSKLPQFFKR